MITSENTETWNVESARQHYNVEGWGAGFFDINSSGNASARPLKGKGAEVDIMEIVREAKERDLHFPLLIRFQDILRQQVASLNEAFRGAIKEFDFKGKYRGVFPVKVNQLREVVEEILDAGKEFQFGLEVGSKPELYAGLALQQDVGDLIVCNGYKDCQYIRTALSGLKLGKEVIMVVEKMEELRHIIEVSAEMNVTPLIGLRVRLLSKSGGKWASSGGENAKFGLSTVELLAACRLLEESGLKDSFKLLHFHIGSQVPDIIAVKKAVQEATRYYAKFRKMGFDIQYIDVGGGLGVDYDGSRSDCESSVNYSLQEYANDVVYYIGDVCNSEKVPHPDVISESGRAIVAHHSVLIVEVFGAIEKTNASDLLKYGDDEHSIVKELLDIRENFLQQQKREAFHDASERREEAHTMFTLGMLELEDKAKIDALYWEIGEKIVASYKGEEFIPEEILKLEDSLGDQYLCNFSVFQSLLDHWALGQLFPIMPIQRLDEAPDREATLVDITCDSDGQINKFIDLRDIKDTLALHKFRANNGSYHLGFFLMGAYQDIMGDLHNLFGRVNEIHVFLDPDEPCGYYFEEVIEGTSIGQALSYVQYDQNEIKRRMKAQVDAAIKSNRLKPSEGMRMLREYERGLKQYTYLIK